VRYVTCDGRRPIAVLKEHLVTCPHHVFKVRRDTRGSANDERLYAAAITVLQQATRTVEPTDDDETTVGTYYLLESFKRAVPAAPGDAVIRIIDTAGATRHIRVAGIEEDRVVIGRSRPVHRRTTTRHVLRTAPTEDVARWCKRVLKARWVAADEEENAQRPCVGTVHLASSFADFLLT